MNMYGWTTWGACEMGYDIGPGRLYKHHTGLIVAVPESYEGDSFLALAQMNEYLEEETFARVTPERLAQAWVDEEARSGASDNPWNWEQLSPEDRACYVRTATAVLTALGVPL